MKFPRGSRVSSDQATRNLDNQNLKSQRTRRMPRWAWFVVFASAAAVCEAKAVAQDLLPFDVSNPKHLRWSSQEAGRIYLLGCEVVARSIRPEHPPKLHPSFVLVLGAKEDQTVRDGNTAEVHLRSWNPARFAEAVVIMATREILKREDVRSLARDTLIAAEAS